MLERRKAAADIKIADLQKVLCKPRQIARGLLF